MPSCDKNGRGTGLPAAVSVYRSRPRWQVCIALLLGACAIAHVIATRLSWSGIPLQTDTGIWAYIGSRILDGALPYRDLWESKPPGIFYTFASVEWLFGVGTDRALLWMDALLSAAVIGVTYVVARRFASRAAAAGGVLLLSIVFCHRGLADWGNNVEKFVALFEMLACYWVLRAVDRPYNWRAWVAAGVCCGLAGLFKQTGILFLMSVGVARLLAGLRNRDALLAIARPIGVMIVGAAVVWLPTVVWMLATGMFESFWQQVVRYDLMRVGSSEVERLRLADPEHWSQVVGTLKLTIILFGPAVVGACCWARQRSRTDEDARSPDLDSTNTSFFIVMVYWLLTTAVYPLAPYGYGHYLLQAAPPAAVIAAWLFDHACMVRTRRIRACATLIVLVIGAAFLRDHVRFTFQRDYRFRRAYARLTVSTESLVRRVRDCTMADQTVMIWPTDYAVSYYARRTTPMEFSNSDVIFKGKIERLDPPMPELLARLRANPPDVIIDSTPLKVVVPPGDDPDAEPYVMVRAGVSLLEAPSENHDMLEGRGLAPLKRWLREHYGGQQRVGESTVYYHGKPWRAWQDWLLPGESR